MLQRYLETLKAEEVKILENFDSLVTQHFASYPKSTPNGHIANKSNIEVIIEKEDIFDQLKNITSDVVTIPHLKMNLSKEFMTEASPLGVLTKNSGTVITELEGNSVTVSCVLNKCDHAFT